MADKESNIDYELIARFLADEASAEEINVVEVWLAESEANQHAFSQIKSLWLETGKIYSHPPSAVDVEAGWNKFKDRVNSSNAVLEEPEKSEHKSRSLYFYLSRVAAVIVIGLTIFIVFHDRSKSTEAIKLVAGENVVTDTLPDGSVTTLNAHSLLSYQKEFGDNERAVSLTGEAFFNVTKNEQKPFHVAVDGATITVLGTSFYVKAYDSLSTIFVGVEEGKVKVVASGTDVVLTAGESIAIDKDTKQSQSLAFNPNDLFWKSQTLVFQNEKLGKVFATLEKKYNISINIANKQILECRLSAKFYEEDIDQIFDIINMNFNLTVLEQNNQYTISGSGCN